MSDSDRVKMIKDIANEFMALVIAATEAQESEMRAKLIANRTGEKREDGT